MTDEQLKDIKPKDRSLTRRQAAYLKRDGKGGSKSGGKGGSKSGRQGGGKRGGKREGSDGNVDNDDETTASYLDNFELNLNTFDDEADGSDADDNNDLAQQGPKRPKNASSPSSPSSPPSVVGSFPNQLGGNLDLLDLQGLAGAGDPVPNGDQLFDVFAPELTRGLGDDQDDRSSGTEESAAGQSLFRSSGSEESAAGQSVVGGSAASSHYYGILGDKSFTSKTMAAVGQELSQRPEMHDTLQGIKAMMAAYQEELQRFKTIVEVQSMQNQETKDLLQEQRERTVQL